MGFIETVRAPELQVWNIFSWGRVLFSFSMERRYALPQLFRQRSGLTVFTKAGKVLVSEPWWGSSRTSALSLSGGSELSNISWAVREISPQSNSEPSSSVIRITREQSLELSWGVCW